jgi:hypothetical protein
MATGEPRGDDVYRPDSPDDSEVPEYEGIRDAEDTLDERGADPHEEGASPPERPLAVDRLGTTEQEQARGESLDDRLAEEEPDPALDGSPADDGNGIGDLPGGTGEPRDDEVGAGRAGRLVAPDEGTHEDEEEDLLAEDVGIDGAAASAEEAAVHVVPDRDQPEQAGRPGPPGGADTPAPPREPPTKR